MWRKGKKRTDEKPFGGDSDGAPPSKRFAKGDSDEDGIVVCELSKSRRVSVKSWQGKIQVDIREFYMKDGQQLPGKKGISLSMDQESTKQAEVVAVSERSGHGGMPVYEFEYTVDSTRGGLKRIFSAAFVASKKLFLLNIAHSDKPDNPVDNQTRMVLEQVLHSFDTTL